MLFNFYLQFKYLFGIDIFEFVLYFAAPKYRTSHKTAFLLVKNSYVVAADMPHGGITYSGNILVSNSYIFRNELTRQIVDKFICNRKRKAPEHIL